jgi:hypothetical protein
MKKISAAKSKVKSTAGREKTVAEENIRQQSTYVVSGIVSSPDRAGVGGLLVQIADKNVGKDALLAKTATDERGCYNVSFTVTLSAKNRKRQPDLQARVYAGQTFLAASDVRYNANNREMLNVQLPANTTQLPSDYETLTGALEAHYSGKLGDLKETDDRQDITSLAKKTGWDARAVALAALADQFSRHRAEGADRAGKMGMHPAFYYGLFRAGLPANPDTLYQADVQTVERVWKQGIEQGVIPKTLEIDLPSAISTFQRLSVQKMLIDPTLVGSSSLKQMLAVSGLNDAKQKQFAELYTAHRTDMPTFWKAVAKAFPDTAKRLQVDGKLGFLTINNAPLMQALHKTVGEKGLSDTLQLAQLGYYRPTKWTPLLTKDIPIPKEIPGDTPEVTRANYAEYLAAQVRLSYPTAAVAQMVKSGELPLTDAAPGVSDQVYAFLTEHQGKFEIGVQPVEQYIAQNNLQVAEETVVQIEQLQRIYQLTPNDDALIGLMKLANKGIKAD